MPYQPIENYGLIGNLRTAALVGLDGSIDWLCLPRFDSPSVFAAVLDDAKGGRFRVAPALADVRHKQFYWPDTNVLVTRFLHADGVAELDDFMPVAGAARDELVRRVRCVRGRMPIALWCRPAFDYARQPHDARLHEHGARFVGPGGMTLNLAASVPLRVDGGRTDNGGAGGAGGASSAGGGATGPAVAAEFTLNEGEAATFVLSLERPEDAAGPPRPCPTADAAEQRFRDTVGYWRAWLGRCTYHGRWREVVHRSALALKLMTYEPTGAIVAAPTCSLPEHVGGRRNWDYRYCWIRDAAFTVYALLRIGFTDEATRFMDWLTHRWDDQEPGPGGPLRLMYAVDGSSGLREQELPHLEGYRQSGPVRIGNGAEDQLQLDIYGELMDSVYLYNKHAAPVGYDAWVRLRGLVDWVADNWQRADEGLWEVRSGRQQFVYSKMMCWVALDRGLRLADKRSFPADRARWVKVRDEIYEQVMRDGWSRNRQAFVQSYGSNALDASNLLMPLVFFTAPNDPRTVSTVDAIRRRVGQGGLAVDGLVYRYSVGDAAGAAAGAAAGLDDGVGGPEGTFNMCSFWLAEALTRAGRTDRGRLDESRLLFEKMLGYANHLGLYAEQTGLSGEALGNFPQAFTHLSLISAAFNLDRALDGR